MEQPNGEIMKIYCHWDGYLSNNGEILQTHYRDRAKVLALMLLGDVSSLRPEIGMAHDFDARYEDKDPRENWCVAYGRDRGETGAEFRVYKNYADYRANAQFEEYNYCYRLDDKWYVEFYGNYDGPLEQALLEDKAAEDA
jgi:hypothetical protein